MSLGPLHIADLHMFAAGLLLAAGALVTLLRRRRLWRSTLACAVAALLCLALTAGAPLLDVPRQPHVAVLVDVSPSTRTAPWRDLAWVQQAAQHFLPDATVTLLPFADGAVVPASAALDERPASRTVLPTVHADAILLFSDGQFTAPDTLPPVYAVLSNWRPADARISSLGYPNHHAAATVVNSTDSACAVTWSPPAAATSVPAGATLLAEHAQQPGQPLEIRVNSQDPWPENNAAALPPPLLPAAQRWWIGQGTPAGFRNISPETLPRDRASLLSAGLIVLSDLSPQQLSPDAESLLASYIRDLGGSVLLIAGESDYALWRNHPLVKLMPLSPDPPAGPRRWIVLLDRSGSMASRQGEATRWETACSAALEMLRRLPGDESVSVGSFSSSLVWHVPGSRVADLLRQPPSLASAASPFGSTELEPALLQLAQQPAGKGTTELLLLSDAQVSFTDIAGTIEKLKAAKLRVSILALSDGTGLPLLQQLCRQTGGVLLRQNDPARWRDAAGDLATAAAPAKRDPRRVMLRWAPPLLPPREAVYANRAWTREGATVLASAGAEAPLVAKWAAGAGIAAIAATQLTPAELQTLATELTRVPADPSLRVNWEEAPGGRLTIRAAQAGKPLNALRLRLRIVPEEAAGVTQEVPLEQTAPGLYTAQWNPPRGPSLGVLLRDQTVADRAALAGLAPPEFLNLGINQANLESLVQQTGGQLITKAAPLNIPRPHQQWRLAPLLGTLGALLLLLTATLMRREPQ